MSNIKRFEDLEVWQHARELCKFLNEIAKYENFAKDFSLKDQIKRSGGSIMDYIAEGFERNGNKELVNFFLFQRFVWRSKISVTQSFRF